MQALRAPEPSGVLVPGQAFFPQLLALPASGEYGPCEQAEMQITGPRWALLSQNLWDGVWGADSSYQYL